MKITIPKTLIQIAKSLSKKGAQAVVVGGAVRDNLLGKECKDWDIEVYNIKDTDALKCTLKEFGSVNSVGKSFGVIKLYVDNVEFDFSLPRLEKKVAKGHKGFDVLSDSSLPFKVAAKRRDFTINTIGYNILEQKILDPFEGVKDLQNRVLRVVDNSSFSEDPLRVYRAVGFAARFHLELEPKTKELCKQMVSQGVLDELPKERIWSEWKKLLLKAIKPSIGFRLMLELGILKRYYPELFALVGVPQEPKYHPEGDVWTHTLMALDAMAQIVRQERIVSEHQRLKLLLAVLCHDLGKAVTTQITDGRIRSIGHEAAGIEPAKSLLASLTNKSGLAQDIEPLIAEHLRPSQLFASNATKSAIRRLATKVNIQELVLVAKADFLGRTTPEAQSGEYKAGEWLLKSAKALNVECKPIDNLITGKDLITLGFTPSTQFKTILDEVYTLQLDGDLQTKQEALKYVRTKWG